MLNLILCGAPGCGKGTQSEFIVNKYGLTHLSTGELMRQEMASESELGQILKSYISQGHLVPDDVTMQLLEQHINSLPKDTKGLIFDGFPRTIPQAEALTNALAAKGEAVEFAIDVEVPDEVIILERGKTSGRADDNLETIKERLKVYHDQTRPVDDYYELNDKYVRIQGLGTISEIFGRICRILDKIY